MKKSLIRMACYKLPFVPLYFATDGSWTVVALTRKVAMQEIINLHFTGAFECPNIIVGLDQKNYYMPKV